jgi:hypothetical protein
MRVAQLSDQVRERDKIVNSERTPTGREHHEGIKVRSISPCPRERALHPTVVEERHAILPPRLANSHERELATKPRMERMRHTDGSLPTRRIKRS